MVKAIALIDSNNFYAACEQMIDPSLAQKPVVILSNNDGCIIARSTEARELQIPMGQPYYKLRHTLERLQIHVRSSNYELYGDMSARLMRLLKSYCEEIEIYSIDEAFIQLTRPENGNLISWARQLRSLVYKNLGLPIAIGISSNKVQAKIANHLAKTIDESSGIFDLGIIKYQDIWLDKIKIEEVWGIGSKIAKWCRLRGIRTARELRDMPSEEIKGKYGVIGVRIQKELKGEKCLGISTTPSPKKETCVSRSFSKPITNIKEFRKAISLYVVRASEKLRAQKQQAGAITIFTRTSPYNPSFYSQAATKVLEIATNNTNVLLKESLALTDQIYSTNYSLVKAGVIMKQLQETRYLQQHLINPINIERQKKEEHLMNVIDNLNKRYGSHSVTWMACGMNKEWNRRRGMLSPAATTKIEEIPIANAE